MSDELNRRNTESVFQRLNDIDVMARETRTMLDNMNQTIASINSRVVALENALNLLRIKDIGNGPTNNG